MSLSSCTTGLTCSPIDMEDKKPLLKHRTKRAVACSYDDLKAKQNKHSYGWGDYDEAMRLKQTHKPPQGDAGACMMSSTCEETDKCTLSASVECVEVYPRVRQRKKRSRTKSSHDQDVGEISWTDSHSTDPKETNTEDSPFLQMLSDELEALRSPKIKHFHPSRPDKKVKDKQASGSDDSDAVKNISKYKTEKMAQSCSKIEERHASDLEEGEIIEDPTETPKKSYKSKRRHRRSHKGKRDMIQVLSECFDLEVDQAVDLTIDTDSDSAVVDLTVDTDTESTFQSANYRETETFRACKTFSRGRIECDGDWSEKIDSPLIRDFARKCRSLTPEEGEISPVESDHQHEHEDSSSSELVLSCDEEIKVEKMRLGLLSSTEGADNICIDTDEPKQHSKCSLSKDTKNPDIFGSVLGKMMHGLYSQDRMDQPTNTATSDEPVGRKSTSSAGCTSSVLPLHSHCPNQRLYTSPQQPQIVPSFLMQYQQQESAYWSQSQTIPPVGYQSPVQTMMHTTQWSTLSQTTSCSTGFSFNSGSVGPPLSVGQLPHVSPLYHPQQSLYHTSNWTQHRPTAQQRTMNSASIVQPGGSMTTIPGILSPNVFPYQFSTYQISQLTHFGAAVLSYYVLFQQAAQNSVVSIPPSSVVNNSVFNTNFTSEISSKLRQWDLVKGVHTKHVGGMEFTVMSYNILAQDYLELNQDLYYNCDPEDLYWDFRGPALIAQITSHNADIVCLQEVQEDHWHRDLKEPFLKHGYLCVYEQKKGQKPDGCAILYKKDKFKRIKYVPVDFNKGGILDRDNIGIILLLQPTPKNTSVSVSKICVATTHLLFNPKRGDVKLAQMMVFLAEIDKHTYLDGNDDGHQIGVCSQASSSQASSSLASSPRKVKIDQRPSVSKGAAAGTQPVSKHKPTYCPIIMCGDFNTEPFCAMYKFITSGYVNYEKCTSKQFCGQKEGQGGGSSSLIDKELLLESLDITQSCQYTPVIRQRFISLPPKRLVKNSGRAYHDLYFKSVYRHSFKDNHGRKIVEISSQHERVAATLDYIFYSTGIIKKEGKNKQNECHQSETTDDPLELLARYRLLTTRDRLATGYIPNKMFPSDHFCLMARFLLR